MRDLNGDMSLSELLGNVDTVFFDFGNTLGEITQSVLDIWIVAAAEHEITIQQNALMEALKEGC